MRVAVCKAAARAQELCMASRAGRRPARPAVADAEAARRIRKTKVRQRGACEGLIHTGDEPLALRMQLELQPTIRV